MSVTAAISALRHDSEVWDHVSTVTRQAGREAAELTLGESQLSWASVPTGLLSTYAEIQNKVVMLLGEAEQVYSDLSVALDKVATAYELSDENMGSLSALWSTADAWSDRVGSPVSSALASTATIVGLPAGPFIAGAAALVASGAIIIGAETLKAVSSSANTALRQRLAENSGFHAGHWPPAARA
jgi:hypothetical protein